MDNLFFQKSRQEAVVSVSGSQEGLESHGRINFGPHSSSLSPAGSSGRFESVIKAPSTRKLYSSKWGVFESWCLTRAIDPVNCPVGPVLEFLQERLTAGAAATTLRVYVAAIAARRELDEIPLGRHQMVSVFMRGVIGRFAPQQFLLGTCQSSSKD